MKAGADLSMHAWRATPACATGSMTSESGPVRLQYLGVDLYMQEYLSVEVEQGVGHRLGEVGEV